jgi:hypothetical protein
MSVSSDLVGISPVWEAGRQAANTAFSGPGKQTLYLTARERLYRVNTPSKDPDRLGK